MYASIQDRSNKAWNTLWSLCKKVHSKYLSLKLKQRLLKCTVAQVFLHGCCTWETSLEASVRLINSQSRKLKKHCNEDYLSDAGDLETADIDLHSMACTRRNKYSSQLRINDPKISDGSPGLEFLHGIILRRHIQQYYGRGNITLSIIPGNPLIEKRSRDQWTISLWSHLIFKFPTPSSVHLFRKMSKEQDQTRKNHLINRKPTSTCKIVLFSGTRSRI